MPGACTVLEPAADVLVFRLGGGALYWDAGADVLSNRTKLEKSVINELSFLVVAISIFFRTFLL